MVQALKQGAVHSHRNPSTLNKWKESYDVYARENANSSNIDLNPNDDPNFIAPPTIQTQKYPIPHKTTYNKNGRKVSNNSDNKYNTNQNTNSSHVDFQTIHNVKRNLGSNTESSQNTVNTNNLNQNYNSANINVDPSRIRKYKNNPNPNSKLFNSGRQKNSDIDGSSSSSSVENLFSSLKAQNRRSQSMGNSNSTSSSGSSSSSSSSSNSSGSNRDNIIRDRLRNVTQADSNDLFGSNNGSSSMSFSEAQNAQKKLEYDSLMMNEMDEYNRQNKSSNGIGNGNRNSKSSGKIGSIPENLENEGLIMNDDYIREDHEYILNDGFDGEETPDFINEYPDSQEREEAIDKYLGKTIDIPKDRPPDAILLPMYASAKDYSKMLHVPVEVIEAQLNDLGVYISNVITQEVMFVVYYIT